MSATQRIPVTLISGFLGAGKTTFLNHLIQSYPEKRFAIIENEFGSTSIDQALVVDAGEHFFEVNQGCLCCSSYTELGQTLKKLLTVREAFDHLLIEASGMADPAGIATAFVGDQQVMTTFVLDGTICLVDGEQFTVSLTENREVAAQLAFADLIILNKTDLVAEQQRNSLEEHIRLLNPQAMLRRAVYGQLNEPSLLSLQAYSADKVRHAVLNTAQHTHQHSQVSSLSFTFDEPFDEKSLMHWLHVLLLIQGKQLLRIKAVLHLAGHSQQTIFQSVRSRYTVEKGSAWGQEPAVSKIVFIGYQLQEKAFRKSLEQSLASRIRRSAAK